MGCWHAAQCIGEAVLWFFAVELDAVMCEEKDTASNGGVVAFVSEGGGNGGVDTVPFVDDGVVIGLELCGGELESCRPFNMSSSGPSMPLLSWTFSSPSLGVNVGGVGLLIPGFGSAGKMSLRIGESCKFLARSTVIRMGSCLLANVGGREYPSAVLPVHCLSRE